MRIKIHHIIAALLLIMLVSSYIRNSSALNRNQYFVDSLRKEAARAEAKNNELRLKEAKSRDPFEAERFMRDKLGFTRDGERIIIAPTTSP